MELNPADLSGTPPSDSTSWRRLLTGSTALTSTGRSALAMVLARMKREEPKLDRFLLPSYLCPSVISPFIAAGMSIDFYAVDRHLRFRPEAIESQVSKTGARGLLFINYFGLPVGAEERAAVAALRARLWIIEDCAAGGLLEGKGVLIGSTGHFAFTSLRKYLPIPDGALIWNRSGLDLDDPPIEDDPAWVRLRVLGKLLRGEYLKTTVGPTAAVLESAYLQIFERSEAMLDATGGFSGPSRTSQSFRQMDLQTLSRQRVQNFRYLQTQFRKTSGALRSLRPLFASLPAGSSPLMFPVLCRDRRHRDALRSHLAERRIFCPVQWPLPPAVEAQLFPEAACLSSSIIGLPVDARYREGDMQYCVDAIADFVEEAAR